MLFTSQDYESTVAPHGFFYGYTNVVIAVIVLQAVGKLSSLLRQCKCWLYSIILVLSILCRWIGGGSGC